jgi:hypothetical protein
MIKTVELVKFLLEDDERCRNSDSYLYLQVVKVVAIKKGIDLKSVTIPDFLLSMGDVFPPFETVRRTRQKVQQHHPELCANERVEAFRAENEKMFREFARCEV